VDKTYATGDYKTGSVGVSTGMVKKTRAKTMRKRDDLYREERKSVPQGLKAEGFCLV
jgi:hypothetical protein